MSSDELKWGVLGCGNIVNDFLLAMERGKRKHKVVAIGASTLERSQAFVQERNYSARAYGSYLEVLLDEEVEVVYVGLRNADHFYYTMKALDKGKHVLCEKPLGVNAKQTKQMIQKANSKRLFLMEAFWSRFLPAYQQIRHTIDTNELGRPRLVHAALGYSLPPDFVNLDRGETMLTTLGCYTVMLSSFVFGAEKPQRISYTGEKNSKGGDSWTSIRLNYGENRDAVLLLDERHFLPNDAFIGFEQGCIKIEGNFWAPTELKITTNGGKTETKTFPLNDDRAFNYTNSSALKYEADHVYDCIKSGKIESDMMPLTETRVIQEIVDDLRNQMKISFPQDRLFVQDLMRTMSLTK